MFRRELVLALRARSTPFAAALAALLVGHGFVLSVDLWTSASRSALSSTLMRRELDPLAGVVRPTLGAVQLATSLLAPMIAARVVAIEKERGTHGALLLQLGSVPRYLAAKGVAAIAATSLVLVAPLVALLAFVAVGGHLDAIETAVALFGHVLHLLLVTAVSLAAAAWTRSLTQAATLAVSASLASWAIDAADGFAALAWLGQLSQWSISAQLAPFERGVLALGSIAWLVTAIVGALVLAAVGLSPTRSRVRAALVLIATTCALVLAARVRRAHDWSEGARASLPPAAVRELRALDRPIAIDVFLDRDDSRRRQLESDVLAKLRLARADIDVRTPLDARPSEAAPSRDDEYGRIVVHVGDASRETRSTSRREIVTLLFDAAGRPLPDWSQPIYPGYPAVIEGGRRRAIVLIAYLLVPLAFVAMGLRAGRGRPQA